MRYILFSEARATQRVRFIDVNRSYVINYGLGRDVVQAWVERQGPDHWQGMETLLASQIAAGGSGRVRRREQGTACATRRRPCSETDPP